MNEQRERTKQGSERRVKKYRRGKSRDQRRKQKRIGRTEKNRFKRIGKERKTYRAVRTEMRTNKDINRAEDITEEKKKKHSFLNSRINK